MSSLKALLSAPTSNALGAVTWDDKDTSSTWLKAGVPVSQSTYSALYAKYGLLGKTTVTFWRSGSCTVDASEFSAITASSSTAIMIGLSNKIRSSQDGIVWTTRSSATSADWYGANYAGGIFVAVGSGGIINTSTDAVTWTRRSVLRNTALNSVAYSGSVYVLVGDSETVATSTDAITWTVRSTPGASNWNLNSLIYGDGIFVVVGNAGSSGSTSIMTSADGITWTLRTPSVTNNQLFSVTYGNNLYVAVGGNNIIMTSTNAITWTTRTALNMASGNYGIVTYAEGVYLIGSIASNSSTNNLIAYSNDGITWSTRNVPPQIANIDSSLNVYSIGYFKGKFLYGGVGYDSGSKVNISTFGYSNLFNYDPATQFVGPSTSPVVTNSPSNIYVKGV